ncbi:MAG: DUF6457 domain-containing protein [Candidatus Binatia bacterium]
MTAQEWLTGFAAVLGVDPPTEAEVRDLLALAGESAHASERIAAPVSCWLIARAGLSPAEALKKVEEWKQADLRRSNKDSGG